MWSETLPPCHCLFQLHMLRLQRKPLDPSSNCRPLSCARIASISQSRITLHPVLLVVPSLHVHVVPNGWRSARRQSKPPRDTLMRFPNYTHDAAVRTADCIGTQPQARQWLLSLTMDGARARNKAASLCGDSCAETPLRYKRQARRPFVHNMDRMSAEERRALQDHEVDRWVLPVPGIAKVPTRLSLSLQDCAEGGSTGRLSTSSPPKVTTGLRLVS